MGKANKKQTDKFSGRVIDFMGKRLIATVFSAILVAGSLISLAVNGLQFGLDFTGGLQIETQFSEPVDVAKVRSTLVDSGIEDAVVVFFGSDRDIKITTQQDRQSMIAVKLTRLVDTLSVENITVEQVGPRQVDRLDEGGLVITVQSDNQNQINELNELLRQFSLDSYQLVGPTDGSYQFLSKDGIQVVTEKLLIKKLKDAIGGNILIKRTEFVGPQVGDELRDQGGIGLLFALAIVMIYVALRFQFKFSVGAVAALAHDVVIVLGFFSLLKLDFDLTVLAAILAVIGYSLNDTIVVSDRIRENFRKIRKGTPADVINQSLTQTLGRTLVTSLTTLLVLLALFFVGGELIHAFSVALIVGIVVGTYSSVYVAANTLLLMNITKEDLMVPEKEGAELDEMP